jgi:hypothetical protein
MYEDRKSSVWTKSGGGSWREGGTSVRVQVLNLPHSNPQAEATTANSNPAALVLPTTLEESLEALASTSALSPVQPHFLFSCVLPLDVQILSQHNLHVPEFPEPWLQ